MAPRLNQGQLPAWGVAAVFLLLAMGAGIAAKVAFEQRTEARAARDQAKQEAQRADRNFTAAKQTALAAVASVV